MLRCLQIAPMVMDLAEGTMDPGAFMEATTYDNLASGVASVQLPAGAGNSTASTQYGGSAATQAAQNSGSSSGLSGGAIAGIVIGVLAGVAIIAALAGLLIRRRNSHSAQTQPTNGPRVSSSSVSLAAAFPGSGAQICPATYASFCNFQHAEKLVRLQSFWRREQEPSSNTV